MQNWLYLNNVSSQVVAVDGTSIVIKGADASKFGNPTEEQPLRLSTFDADGNPLEEVLIVTARSGSTLTVSEGTATVGMTVSNVPRAEDLTEIQTSLASKQEVLPLNGTSGQFLAHDFVFREPTMNLSSYYDRDEVNGLLEGKEDKLPTVTPAGKFLRDDKTWQAVSSSPGGSTTQIQFNDGGAFGGSSSLVFDKANKRVGISRTPDSTLDVQANSTEDLLTLRNSSGTPLVKVLNNGGFTPRKIRFVLGRYVDLAAGTITLPGIADYAGTITKVQVLATTNPVGGGFTFDIKKNGTSIFSAGKTIAANVQTLQTITDFASTSVSAGDLFTIDVSSPGTAVQNVIVELIYLSRNQ